jgi:hypothetical protein
MCKMPQEGRLARDLFTVSLRHQFLPRVFEHTNVVNLPIPPVLRSLLGSCQQHYHRECAVPPVKKKSVAKAMRWQCVHCHQAKARQDEAIAKRHEKEMRRGAAAAATPLAATAGSAAAAQAAAAQAAAAQAAAAQAAPSHAALFSFSQCLPTSFTFYVRFIWLLAVMHVLGSHRLLDLSPNPLTALPTGG